jgi:hypothetical protein
MCTSILLTLQLFGQQPRPAQQSVPLQKLFGHSSSQPLPSAQPIRPPVLSVNHPPLLPSSAVLQNPVMQPSASPLMLQQMSPHASSPISKLAIRGLIKLNIMDL